jgi:hypothetical protein
MKKINIRNPAEVIAAALEETIKVIKNAEKEMKGRTPPKIIKEREIMELHLANIMSNDGPYIDPTDDEKLKLIENFKKKIIHLTRAGLIHQFAETKINLDLETKQHQATVNALILLEERWMGVLDNKIITGNKIRTKKTSGDTYHGNKYQLSISTLNEIRPTKKWQPEDFKVFIKKMKSKGIDIKDTTARSHFFKVTGLRSTK